MPRRIQVLPTSAGYFDVWGISPLLGRGLAVDEEREDANVVILSYRLWQSHTGGDPNVLGTTIRLDGAAYTVIGVAPAGFRDAAVGDVDAWVPLDLPEGEYSRQNHFLSIIGRLDRGVSVEQGQTYVSAVNARIVEEHDEVNDSQLMRVVSLHDDVVGSTDTMLRILMGAAGLVLLIACVNVANLFLARSLGRRREIAIRSALGSGRGRLVRQFFAESLLVATLAGLAGLVVAHIGVRFLLSISPEAVARSQEVGIDARLLLFAGLVTVLTALLFGLVPALRGSRVDLTSDLREGSRGMAGGKRSTRVRAALVATQVALALVLLIGAGILIKSFAALQGQDYGFDSSDLLTFEVHLPDARYEDPVLRVDFHQRFHEKLRSIPGVESVAATSWLPAAGPYHDWGFRYETADGAQDWEGAQMRIIEGDYFETMGIPLRAGRTFNAGDGEDSPPVMVISETAAEIAFPGRDAIGQQFYSAGTDRTVIGVVPDVAFDARGSRKSKIYIPHTEYGDDRNWALVQVVKTSAGLGVLPQIRRRAGRHRSGAGDLPGQDHGAGSRPTHGEREVRSHPDGDLQRSGAPAGGDRRVRHSLLLRQPAHARVRDPDGARRHYGRRAASRPRPGRDAGRPRPSHRAARSLLAQQAAPEHGVRGERHGPRDLRAGDPDPGLRRTRGGLRAGAEGHEGHAHAGAAGRVGASRFPRYLPGMAARCRPAPGRRRGSFLAVLLILGAAAGPLGIRGTARSQQESAVSAVVHPGDWGIRRLSTRCGAVRSA